MARLADLPACQPCTQLPLDYIAHRGAAETNCSISSGSLPLPPRILANISRLPLSPTSLERRCPNRHITMNLDFADGADLEGQPQVPRAAAITSAVGPSHSLAEAPHPLVATDTPRSRASGFDHGSQLSPAYSSTIQPDTRASSITCLATPTNSSRMKHKSTGSAGSGLSLQSIGDHQSGQPTTPPLSTLMQEKAHRYMGYPAFSSLLSSDNDSFVVRKFGTLHVRTILMLQDKIAELEDRLAVIDRDVQERQGDEYLCHNGSFRGDQQWHDERYEMMLNLARLLEQYGKSLSRPVCLAEVDSIKRQPGLEIHTVETTAGTYEAHPEKPRSMVQQVPAGNNRLRDRVSIRRKTA